MSSKVEFRPPTHKEAANSMCALLYKESRREAVIYFVSQYGRDFFVRVKKELSLTKKGQAILAEIDG